MGSHYVNKQKRLIEVKEKAKSRGGRCTSRAYTRDEEKLSFVCGKKHKFMAKASLILSGSWCPYCGRNKVEWSEVQAMAEAKGGKCVSSKKQNINPFFIVCEVGHFFSIMAKDLRRGRWCPKCSTTRRLNLEVFQRHAESMNGKCLSTEYKNSFTNMKWQCEKGHIWEATGKNVRKNGTWCPHCFIDRKKVAKSNDK